MFTSLSAVDREAAKSFTKLMALCALAHDEDYKLSRAVKGKMKYWYSTSLPFVTRFKLGQPLYKKVLNGLYKQQSPSEHDQMIEDTEALAEALKKKISEIDKEADVETYEYKIIKDFYTVALRSSEPALARITKALTHLDEPSLSALTNTEVIDQSDIAEQLVKHVKKMGGKGMEITPELRKEFGADKESLKARKLKEYNRLRRELNSSPKQFIMQMVRSSGKKYLPVHEVLAGLKDANISYHSVPLGYKGFIDDQLGYYTVAELKLNGTPAGDVIMNTDYDPKSDNGYVCTAQAPMAKAPSRIYTVNYKQGNNEKKFKAVGDLQKVIKKVRAKWKSHLKLGLDDQKCVLALCCEIVYITSARVGSANGNTAGEKTYGLTSLTVGHMKVKGNDRLLQYAGKKSQIQKHMIRPSSATNKQVVDYLDEMADGKSRKDNLITFRGKKITGGMINKYLKSIGVPAGVTIHKFRTLRGTELASEALSKSPFKNRTRQPTAAQVNEWLKKQLEKVAKELGHFTNGKLTINTAIQNYIDPKLLEDFFKEAAVRPNAVIARSIELAKKKG